MILNSLSKNICRIIWRQWRPKIMNEPQKTNFFVLWKKPVCNFRWENEGSLSLELTSSCLKGGGWWCMTCHHQEWKVWVCKRRDTACIKHSLPENHFQPQLSKPVLSQPMFYKHWIGHECLRLVDLNQIRIEFENRNWLTCFLVLGIGLIFRLTLTMLVNNNIKKSHSASSGRVFICH